MSNNYLIWIQSCIIHGIIASNDLDFSYDKMKMYFTFVLYINFLTIIKMIIATLFRLILSENV